MSNTKRGFLAPLFFRYVLDHHKFDPYQFIQSIALLVSTLTQSTLPEDVKMDMLQNSQEIELPWYRYGMVWMVILLPMLVVLASSFTIYIAYSNAPDIVPPAITQSK